MLDVLENHHRGAEFLEVRTWGFVEVFLNKVRGLLEDAVEAVVVFEESLAGCHDGVVLSRGGWGSFLRFQNGHLQVSPFARGMGESLGPAPWERAGGTRRPARLADGIVGEAGGWGHSLAGLCGNRGGRMMVEALGFRLEAGGFRLEAGDWRP